jgi:glycine cleavage system H protein
MNVPENLKYTAEHEWVRAESDGTVTVGITDHAQSALGDLVFVEVPEAGRKLAAGEACCVVESVKAASDVYSPIAGEVVEANGALADAPERVNQDPYAAWLFRLKPANAADVAKLLDAAAYRKAVEAAGESQG